jgi:hypothetical protein
MEHMMGKLSLGENMDAASMGAPTGQDSFLKATEYTTLNQPSSSIRPLSKEALFISKLVAVCCSNGNDNVYKKSHSIYKEFLESELPKATKEFIESGKPTKNPLVQLVFNLEDMFDEVYKEAKKDARVEIMTELEAAYTMKRRGVNSTALTGQASPWGVKTHIESTCDHPSDEHCKDTCVDYTSYEEPSADMEMDGPAYRPSLHLDVADFI